MTETTARSPEAPERATPATPDDLRDAAKWLIGMGWKLPTQCASRLEALADELDSPPSVQEIREAMFRVRRRLNRLFPKISPELAGEFQDFEDAYGVLLSLISRRLQETSEPKKIEWRQSGAEIVGIVAGVCFFTIEVRGKDLHPKYALWSDQIDYSFASDFVPVLKGKAETKLREFVASLTEAR